MPDLDDDSWLYNRVETDIEGKAVKYAEERGWWAAKFVSPGRRGVPDRIFIRDGRVLFIEFKKDGKEPTAQQLKKHRDMVAHGAEVHWVHNLKQAYDLLR